MALPIVERLTARVSLDPEPEWEFERARRQAAAGDESWAEWLADIDVGRALIVRLDLELQLRVADEVRRCSVEEPGVWLELVPHRPQVECQVQDAATMALTRADEVLAEIGAADLPANELGGMCVSVRLDPDILERLPRH